MKQINLHSNKPDHTQLVCRQPIRSNNSQDGFSLIEVMVSAFVLGIGILGIVGLQVISVKGTQQSYMRHQATNMIQSLAEKMRANIKGTLASNYVVVDSNTAIDCSTALPAADDCATTTATCSAAEVATFDLYRLVCGYDTSDGKQTGGLKNMLTAGKLEVACQINAAGVALCDKGEVSIKVSWSERAFDKASEASVVPDTLQLNTRIAR